MVRDSADVTDAELAVLEVLWRRGATPIRPIADDLYPGGSASEYATVQKLLQRLERKGFVTRDRSGFAHVFRATVEKGDLIGRRLTKVAQKLCGGSLAPLLVHLVEAGKLSPADRETLRKLLDEEE